MTLPQVYHRARTLLSITVLYICAGRLGLSFAFINESVSPIWPPTGLSIAAIILFGFEVWPAIFLGAFIVNLVPEGTYVTALTVALGNTLEACAGGYLTMRYAQGGSAFDRIPDLLRFSVLAGVIATMISPSIGLTALAYAGYASRDTYLLTWITWWLGDMGGALVLGPLLIIWGRDDTLHWNRGRILEAVALGLALVLVGGVVFGPVGLLSRNHYPIAFLCFAVVLWSAFRFESRGAILVSFALMIIAIFGTLSGRGPFSIGTPNVSLLLLQFYMGFTTIVGLSVAAAIRERRAVEHRLEKAAEIVRRRAEDLMEADKRKDEFIAMLSHELRNPLSTISTGVELLQRGGVVVHEEKIHAMVLDEVKHLARLIEDLLDVSRITKGKIRLQQKPCVLGDVLKSAIDSVRILVDEKNQNMVVHIPKEPVAVFGDRSRLKQIFVNLLTNASKYTNADGEIFVTVEGAEPWIEIRIRDTGIGLSAEMLPRIFDLFTQADTSLDRSQGGLGIGLTLVKRLAEIHGGRVTAKSDGLGTGSEFCVRLPTCEAEVERDSTPVGRSDGTRMPTSRILIVDDNILSAELLGQLLEDDGHSVQLAEDGLEALKIASEFEPQIILLDIGLPVMDGYEVAKHLRKNEKFSTVCVVGISGYGQEQEIANSKRAGFDYHLVKPLEYATLKDLLAKHFITPR